MTTTLLDPLAQPRFINAVPVPIALDWRGGGSHALYIVQSTQWLGPVDPVTGLPLDTTVWGYSTTLVPTGPVYPGPTILAWSGAALDVTWVNALPLSGHILPVDDTIMIAPTGDPNLIPVVTHLHGGATASESDGLPTAWWTQVAGVVGMDYAGNSFTYDNMQQAATLWYHDHALGLTRLNVYAGLAGFYLLKDEHEASLIERRILPERDYQFGLAIQDRAFTSDGQLYFPSKPGDPLPGGGEVEAFFDPMTGEPIDPTTLPEFFGDHILVNGMAWPVMEVDPGYYRFHLLNGSDSRFYLLELSDPDVRGWIVGSDGGLLSDPIRIFDGNGRQEAWERLVLAPGDRVELVLDFSKARGSDVTLLNFGTAFDPFKGLDATGALAGDVTGARDTEDLAETVGQVMQFQVSAQNLDRGNDRVNIEAGMGGKLNPDYVRLTERDADNAADVRKLGLFEGEDMYGRVMPMLGLAEQQGDEEFGPRMFHDDVTEVIRLGHTEIWEIHNLTEDAHPIHLHLVQFQVLGRYASIAQDTDNDGETDAVELGAMLDTDPWRPGTQNLYATDQGWQDTSWLGPGEAIRIIAEFDRAGLYVWHCHILSHEDNEMMRPFVVYDPNALIA